MNFLERINIESVLHAFYYNKDKNRPLLGIAGGVTIVDRDGNPIDVESSSSGALGGNNVYSTAAGDFTTAVTVGTKLITLTGLSFPLTIDNLVLADIKKVDLDGNITAIAVNKITLTGPDSFIIDSAEEDFITGDEIVIAMSGPDKAYDQPQDLFRFERQNPEWDHYNSIEHIVDIVNGSPETYFIAFEVGAYRNLAIQLNASDDTGASFILYGTLDEDAVIPATGGTAGPTWVNMNDMLLDGVVSGTSISELSFVDTSYMPDRYLIEYTIQNAANTVDCWIRKY